MKGRQLSEAREKGWRGVWENQGRSLSQPHPLFSLSFILCPLRTVLRDDLLMTSFLLTVPLGESLVGESFVFLHQPHPTERDRWRERKKSNSEVVRKNRQKTLCPVPEDAPVFGRWQGWVDKSLPGGLFLGWEVNVNRILSSLSAVLKRWIRRGQQGKTAVNHFPTKATRDLSETHPTCPYSSKNQ